MKKNICKLMIVSCLLVGLSSCDLEAPVVSTLPEGDIFSNYETATAAVLGAHNSFCETNSYRGRFTPYYGLNTDVEWINGLDPTKLPDGDKYDLTTYATKPNNAQMNTDNNAWAKLYEGVERLNIAIKGLRESGNIANRPEMAQLLGEALAIRATIYVDLIKGWGDVPGRFEPAMYSQTSGRTDRDVIYKQLLADLKEAEGYCYWPNESTVTRSTERVSKVYVKGLRARIALYAGGYSQRADGIRLSQDPELSRDKMYLIAKEECLGIINQGTNQLGSFIDNWRKLCQDNVTAGGESIYELPYSDGRGRVLYTFGIKHNAQDQYTGQAQGGVNGPLPYLFYDYDIEDIRRDITCVPYDWSATNPSKQQIEGGSTSAKRWDFGKLRYEWMTRRVTSTNDDGVNWQFMRLADIYMMAAEAINELEGPAAAAPYLKSILDRALPAAKVTALMDSYTANKDTFFQGIVDQRAFEFAGEMLRKQDLIRWNMLKAKLDVAKQKLRDLSTRSGKYADLPEYLYYKTADDGETIIIYGLNHGDTDEYGATLSGYGKRRWLGVDGNGAKTIPDNLINALYTGDPDTHQFWPIWTYFIQASNGTLNNDWLPED
ncbi:MAG: RagB/SusD family nutrient uptake outer membrane protein [Dysgonamonadaceae bacterium]|jgi:hypothetical protein|nr:RagB/SusD family nutrient uptake outer membrane protein [Dysgonamonadaceae bacterium]